MSIKRYHPRYKKLTKFRPPLWFEKRYKFAKFLREKWSRVIRGFYKRRFQCFQQDVLSATMNRRYYGRKSRRFKRTFRFRLRDKQRLQVFYSNDRLRHFQLKALARKSIKIANNRKLIRPTVFLSLLENRLFNLLYRLGYTRSLQQGKTLVTEGHFKTDFNEIKNYNFTLEKYSFIELDPKIIFLINYYYLKYSHTFKFRKRKFKMHQNIFQKQQSFKYDIIENSIDEDIILFKKIFKLSKSSRLRKWKANCLIKQVSLVPEQEVKQKLVQNSRVDPPKVNKSLKPTKKVDEKKSQK